MSKFILSTSLPRQSCSLDTSSSIVTAHCAFLALLRTLPPCAADPSLFSYLETFLRNSFKGLRDWLACTCIALTWHRFSSLDSRPSRYWNITCNACRFCTSRWYSAEAPFWSCRALPTLRTMSMAAMTTTLVLCFL
jgi:hypothetical protein